MVAATFPRALVRTLSHEGEWSDHPSDPGGATFKGITLATLRAWRKDPGVTKAQLRALGSDEIARIYRVEYWNAVAGDGLRPGVDAVVFDAGVNSGPRRALGWYQDVRQALPASAALDTDLALVRGYSDRRRRFLRGLKTWSVFGKGWLRRVADIEAFGLALAMEAAKFTPAEVAGRLKAEATAASGKAAQATPKAQKAGAGAAAGTAGGGVGIDQGAPWEALFAFGVIVAIGALLAFVFIHQARAQRARAEALLREAAHV